MVFPPLLGDKGAAAQQKRLPCPSKHVLGELFVPHGLVSLEGNLAYERFLSLVDREEDADFRIRIPPLEGHECIRESLPLVKLFDGLSAVLRIEETVARIHKERGCLENLVGGQRFVPFHFHDQPLALSDPDSQKGPLPLVAWSEPFDPHPRYGIAELSVIVLDPLHPPFQSIPRYPGPDPENLTDLARISVLYAFQLDRAEPDVVATFDPVIESEGAIFGILLEAGGYLGVIPALPLVQGFDQRDLSGQGVLAKGIPLLHGEDAIDGGGKDQPVPLDPDSTDPFDLPEVEQDRDPFGRLFYLNRHRSEEPARLEGPLDGPDLVDGCPAAFPQGNQGQECLWRRGVVLGAEIDADDRQSLCLCRSLARKGQEDEPKKNEPLWKIS